MIDIESWIAAYEKAWATDDADDVAALFTEDAEYFEAPYRDAITPRDAIVAWWLAEGGAGRSDVRVGAGRADRGDGGRSGAHGVPG